MNEIDWRIKATGRVKKRAVIPATGDVFDKGSIIKLVSVINFTKKRTLTIPVPDLTAIYISSSEKSWNQYSKLKKKHNIISTLKRQTSFKTDKAAFDAVEYIATSVITAYSAIESFCNDSIPNDHEFWHHKRSEIILEKSAKPDIERYFSTMNKLNNILPEIYNVDPPKGKSPVWVSFKLLKSCRDSLIHAKSNETRSVGSSDSNLWDKLFKLNKPYILARDIFNWYLSDHVNQPLWYKEYPN